MSREMLKISTRKVVFAALSWAAALVAVEAYALYNSFGFTVSLALADAVNFNLLIATAGYITYVSMRYYQPNPKNVIYLIVWDIGLAVLCVLAHNYLMINGPFSRTATYLVYLDESQVFRGILAWLMITLMGIISWTWFFMQDVRAGEKRESDTMRLARDAELATLRQQLQPHFLFNSLNSISALAGARPEQARKMIQQLSDFLRGTIKKDDHQLVSLQEEFSHLELYLDIEKVRFGHRLRTEITIDDIARPNLLPSLLLQPIVENAIKFGLYDTTGEIVIKIEALAADKQLLLRVQNPFDPETSQPRQGTGFGLMSVQRRLYLLYGRNDLLTTRTEEKIFITEVKIPQSV
ncbi:MAG TPA: histidine kinase [Chryseolinea sp.]|nr:histidine kinase [Chryseolinea sp.]